MYKYADQTAFDPSLPFYKGNLHCHSTVSDGRQTREALREKYRAAGYGFLCYSDHEMYTDLTALETEDFITLPGVEWSCAPKNVLAHTITHHMHGVAGTRAMLEAAAERPFRDGEVLPRLTFKGTETPAEMRAYVAARGCLTIYNHPVWSCATPEDIGALEGYTAIEVYNNGCELENRTGFAAYHWDRLLTAGRRIFGVATDDNHNRSIPDDSCGGWIMVNAPVLTREAVTGAIAAGRFYASTGPVIRNYGIAGGEVFVECGPVHHIHVVAGGIIGAGRSFWSADGRDSLTGARFALGGHERYVRIECVAGNGAIAWSNPMYPAEG